MRATNAELLDEARKIVDIIVDGLPDEFDIAMLTDKSKLPFKALSYREALLHRFADLAASAIDALGAGLSIAAATLSRACMETMARIAELQERLDSFLIDQKLPEFDEFLMNRLFGAKLAGPPRCDKHTQLLIEPTRAYRIFVRAMIGCLNLLIQTTRAPSEHSQKSIISTLRLCLQMPNDEITYYL